MCEKQRGEVPFEVWMFKLGRRRSFDLPKEANVGGQDLV